jgi:hypothetical protein
MGGQGKTLLLKRIFQLPEIRQHFDHQVLWEISQKINDKELLRQLLREVEPNHRRDSTMWNLSKEELIKEILEKLEGKSYLFALEDVWTRDVWNEIVLLPSIRDKVVVTTRHENIAKALGARDHILPKNSLSDENS